MPVSGSTNLRSLWCAGIDDRDAVIHTNGDTMSRRDLFALAQQLSVQIKGKRVAIFCASSQMEAVALLAAMHASSPMVFPSTNQPENLREIQGSFDVLLTDEPAVSGIEQISLSEISPSNAVPVEVSKAPIDPNLRMTFFTSGSTGKPKEIGKYFYQMDREIRVWQDLYGSELDGAEVHSTVSHQHIYGLLFRLLWPLCAGRPFTADAAKKWEDISQQTSLEKPFILITSPTHLSRLSPLENENVLVRPLLTFSAGGVLHNEFALKAAKYLGRPVLEVYGSTETGAIAKRHNKGTDEAWQLLPGVQILRDARQCLQVKSDFLTHPDDIFQTEDVVSFTENGSFTLRGRADRIVKIEGKRVSLPRTEELLQNHDWVQDVFTKMVGAERLVLGAVVVLSEKGVEFLNQHGKFRTGRHLRDHLKQFDDAVTGPRRWRFVDLIPRNSQGKIRSADIETLFFKEPDDQKDMKEAFKNTSFVELAQDSIGDEVQIRFRLPENLDFFRGHFTNMPLLPGVVQLHWAVEKTNEIFGIEGQPHKIEKLKFKQFLFPDMEAILTLKQVKEGKISFLYHSLDMSGELIEYSSGILNFKGGE